MAAPELNLETPGLREREAGARARRALLLPLSLALHAALVLSLVVVPLVVPEALPPPTTTVKGFFVSPISAPLPPPPPPPPAPASRPAAAAPVPPTRKDTPAFTAPIATPQQLKPEEGAAPGGGGGQAAATEVGGVAGGVPGGVVGGVVGGVKDTPAPPQPLRVGAAVKEPRKLRHVEAVYPRAAVQARVEGIVVLECTIDVSGHVADVKVLRGVGVLDEAAITAVKQWAYAPTLLDGVPVPVIMTVTVSFNLRQAR
jgi:periplasmic protein TonB